MLGLRTRPGYWVRKALEGRSHYRHTRTPAAIGRLAAFVRPWHQRMSVVRRRTGRLLRQRCRYP